MKGWLDGSIDNHGIMLRAVDESSNDQTVGFWSSDKGQADKHPELKIYYTMP